MRLKSWESPRREGRNDKGKGGSARQRQLKKQRQMLRRKLKEASKPENNSNNRQRGEVYLPSIFLQFCSWSGDINFHALFLARAINIT
ncbi:MAG: hypothetical protein KME23_08550 [Goleter apudmare HA4340-LM2]|nr:hypothetical protein [Goleter apudmare HA4340-LM2]